MTDRHRQIQTGPQKEPRLDVSSIPCIAQFGVAKHASGGQRVLRVVFSFLLGAAPALLDTLPPTWHSARGPRSRGMMQPACTPGSLSGACPSQLCHMRATQWHW